MKVKVKLSLYLTNLALRRAGVWGRGCIDAPRFLDFGTSWRWVVNFTPRPLSPRGRIPDTHWIGGWVDPRAGLDDMEKWKFLTLQGLGLRPLGRPALSNVVTVLELVYVTKDFACSLHPVVSRSYGYDAALFVVGGTVPSITFGLLVTLSLVEDAYIAGVNIVRIVIAQ
jgi:hypothetical protein